jgi:uncharacterized small protein (DUF1192 family)
MEINDLTPRPAADPLSLVVSEDLDRLSVADLEDRIRRLEAEIARSRAKLDGANRFRAVADRLFKPG